MEREFVKKVLLALGIVLGTIVIFGGALLWFRQDISKNAAAIASSRVLVGRNIQAMELLAELKKTAAQVDVYERQMKMLLPTQDELINVPRWIEEAAKSHDVALNMAFQPGGIIAPQNEEPGQIGLEINATGSYDKLVKFLEEIEMRSPRLVVVLRSLDLTRVDGGYRLNSIGGLYFRP